jgi:hypothetical protein
MMKAINEERQWFLHTTNPDVDTPETSMTETSMAETSMAETSMAETSMAETSMAVTSMPETPMPETSMKAEAFAAVYIILIQGHETSNIATNLIYQLVNLEGKESLNKRAFFFVVMTDSFEFPQKLAEKIIERLWVGYKVLDVLLLIPVPSHDIETENSISGGKSVYNLYIWLPFYLSGNEVGLLNIFYVDTEVESLHNSNLLSNRIPRKFQNHKTLSTMTTGIKPIALLVANTSDEMNKTLRV